MSKLSLEPGTQYGRWTVLHWQQSKKRYAVLCACGNIRFLISSDIKSGKSKSCGCYNLERLVERSSKPGYYAMMYQVFVNYIKQAKLRNYSFELTFDQFDNLCKQNCHYCNSVPSNTFRGHRRKFKETEGFRYSGIDRKINSLGYTLDNSVPCCQKCNFAKKDYDYDDWILWIKKVYENLYEVKE